MLATTQYVMTAMVDSVVVSHHRLPDRALLATNVDYLVASETASDTVITNVLNRI
jgi:hypothetical protein